MNQMKQKLTALVGAFAVGAVVVLIALAVIEFEAESPELASAAALTAAVFGTAGLLIALRWWSTAGETVLEPNRLQIGFIVRIAIAEVGLFMGILGFVMSGSMLAPLVGGALFLGALVLMALGLRRI